MLWKVRNRTFDFGVSPLVMGVLNVTPDSFSDGGRWLEVEQAVQQGIRLLEEGADILDVGGESSRPGATPVSEEDEMRRVLPVIEELASRTRACISVDTYKPGVASAAIQAGAHVINDITGLQSAAMRRVVQKTGAGAIAMHMQGTPSDMQQAPAYEDVLREVCTFLQDTLESCSHDGIEPERIALDPGIGFGKTVEHNLELLRGLGRLLETGRPIVLGASRKSFLQTLTGDREWATLALSSYATAQGVSVLRVHDVAGNLAAIRASRNLLEDCA